MPPLRSSARVTRRGYAFRSRGRLTGGGTRPHAAALRTIAAPACRGRAPRGERGPVRAPSGTRGSSGPAAGHVRRPSAARPVPACPDWTARDLFSHMAGLGTDVVGRATSPTSTTRTGPRHRSRSAAGGSSTSSSPNGPRSPGRCRTGCATTRRGR
ncbi:maleylpyruvate isomerase N-terminal domain-containing protein [Pseudonocardia oroxyli]|uniref:maleylpyruvate isomerase N-terminal domain-containing protein n=1 Tax=Pseudonocardia oroxyli TaxID=366584 RepID=UPI003CCC1974